MLSGAGGIGESMNRHERIRAAFDHITPDRTPLFEIFQPYQPIHWLISGRTIGTDQAMAWDAMSEGVAAQELVEAEARAAFEVARFFELDMVRLNAATPANYSRPVKLAVDQWELNDIQYVLNPRTKLVEPAVPVADSDRISEDCLRQQIEAYSDEPEPVAAIDPVYARVRELAQAEGIDFVYMAEIGAGTGVAFYPPFMLMWLLTEPELLHKWLDRTSRIAMLLTKQIVAQGYEVVALGGDVSSDKGPFISPAAYREFILPVIREHVRTVQQAGALAVYTSDGNHWPIKQEFFFDSGIDGYKEVDRAAGMTMERLIEEGIDTRVCIIGNIDARYTLCMGTEQQVHDEVLDCLEKGRISPGGHILHASHSVHEDVIPQNYLAAVNAYREYFGLDKISF